MTIRIKDIAKALGAEAVGDTDLLVSSPAEPSNAKADQLALAMSPRYEATLRSTKAQAAIVWSGANWPELGLKAAIILSNPRLAMSDLTKCFDVGEHKIGISENADIDKSAKLASDIYVGAFSLIGAGAEIGFNTQIESHVSIAAGAKIGANCRLHAGVRICRNVVIGDNTIIQPNAVIGGDGFSFATEETSNEERAFATLGRDPLDPPQNATRHRVHSIGGVIIGANVEIGANSTVDAGTIRPTCVGNGTKVDNLVQIGHNVVVGNDCVLSAQSAVAGSSTIGDRSVLGGKSGVKDNISIGTDVVLAGGAIVLQDVPNGRFMMGYPAIEMPAFRERQKGLRNLPRLLRDLKSR